MSVRVIAGRAHGRRLRVPSGGRTRPTSGLVRGALFNMLEHRGWVADAVLLDLFAGTGALGIEALSRGARRVIFVESAPAAIRALRHNLWRSGLSRRGELLATTAAQALRKLAGRGMQVDGVFADPPYGMRVAQRCLDGLVQAGVLAPSGWVALEHRVDEEPQATGRLEVVTRRRHGDTVLTLLGPMEESG